MSRRRVWWIALPVLVLLAAAGIAAALVATRPEPGKQEAPRRGTLVEVVAVQRTPHPLVVDAQGTVRAARRVEIQPQVAGEVVAVHPDLEPGGIVRAGETLLAIDPADFRLAVEIQEAALAEARSLLAQERGRQEVAEREWELFGDQLGAAERDPALALRQPQLEAARGAVESAEARLEQARLELGRSRLEAPFTALVVDEAVDLGQSVGPQTPVATLAGTDAFWVEVAVPVDRLPYIRAGSESGSTATVRWELGGGQVLIREGRVGRILGGLDPAGRMARLLVTVPDPLDLAGDDRGRLPLLLDSWVEVEIDSGEMLAAIEIDRQHLHGDGDDGDHGGHVHLFRDGRLEVREVEIGWRLPRSVLITGGLEEGDLLITTPLPSAVDGMPLRRNGDGATRRHAG